MSQLIADAQLKRTRKNYFVPTEKERELELKKELETQISKTKLSIEVTETRKVQRETKLIELSEKLNKLKEDPLQQNQNEEEKVNPSDNLKKPKKGR